MAAGEITPFPQRLSRGGVQTRRSKTAKVNIHASHLNHRRRRGVAIHRGAIAQRLRIVRVKQVFVKENLARLFVHADGVEIVALDRRSRHPNLSAHDHRGGPSAMRNLRLPLHIVRLAPRQRQPDGFGVTGSQNRPVASWPAKLGPVRPGRRAVQGRHD